MKQAQPGTRGAIVAATAADVRDVMVEGESGLHTLYPSLNYEPSKRRLTWPNGAQASLFSADEPDRLRGPQFHWAIADELAAWRYPEAWDMLMLGLRLGIDPRCAVATTPRPTRIVKELAAKKTTFVTRGNTYENRDNLAPAFFEQIVSQYEGTRLGRQEINAEILDDMPGALWTRDMLDKCRVVQTPQLTRIVIAVDPETTATETSAETGIGAAGLGIDKHGYVLEDKTIKGSPLTWAKQAVSLYHILRADRIIYEANQGGDMVAHTLHSVDPTVPLKAVHASKNKQARAEPIVAFYEQNRAHHVGMFQDLEDQQCNWVPNTGQPSPDRIDWCVWALTELMLGGGEATVVADPFANW